MSTAVAPGATAAPPRPARRRGLRAALVLALVVAAADGFLLWGRALATPVGAEQAAASYLTAPAPRRGPARAAAAGRGLPLPDQRA